MIAAAPGAYAQSSESQDRLSRLRDITRNSELILSWTQDEVGGETVASHRIYDLDLVQADVSQRLEPRPIQTEGEVTGRRRIAVTTGNFTGSEFEHLASAWTGPEGSITIVVPEINPDELDWTNAARISADGVMSSALSAKMRLASGDLVGDDFRDEFVLAFQGDDDMVHIEVYGLGGDGLEPHLLGNIADETLLAGLEAWDVVVGDLDDDGHDDIALLLVAPDSESEWAVTAKIYRVNENGSVAPGPRAGVFPRPDFSLTAVDLSGATGDFDEDAALEIAVAFTFAQDDPEPDTYLYILEIDPDLSTIITSPGMRATLDAQNESEITPLNIAAGDLDFDFRDEIVLATTGSWRAYKIEDELVPQQWKTGGAVQPADRQHSDSFLKVDDMDADGKAEIIFAGSFVDLEPNGTQYFVLTVFSLDVDSIPRVVASRTNEMPEGNDRSRRHFAIALGDFDADRMRLGPPVRYRRSNVLQPSVVLHTPPVHYDILDGTVYDLSGCFPDHSCGFLSTYTQTQSTDLTVAVEVHADWGISETHSVEAELKLKATKTYGEKFSLTSSRGETMTVTTGRVAAGDDWIYANVLDILYSEYPVYEGDDPTPIGYFLVATPEEVRPLWIEGKDDGLLANQFRADHEVGNILSYPPTNAADVAETIFSFNEETIGSSGSSSAVLNMTRFSESGATTSWESSHEVSGTVGVKAEIFGIDLGSEVEVKGTYRMGEITTQTVRAQESLEMRADFGSLRTEFGTAGTYYVAPYAYWTVYGALALDYRVALPSGASTFWQKHYGDKTDVGLSLPWRYDIHKGIPLPDADPSYVQRTRDIVLSNPRPEGGDTVQIGVRVRNMGLADIATPVDVDFYLGDPDGDGELIASTTTASTIPARESEDVFVEWVVPASMSFLSLSEARIYVQLDAAGSLTNEVHVNNQVGWAPAASIGEATHRDRDFRDRPFPRDFVLEEAFPNPTSGLTTVRLGLPEAARVAMQVYDLLGRRVATVTDNAMPAGSQRLTFDASELASGIYIYEVIIRPVASPSHLERETGKLVVAR